MSGQVERPGYFHCPFCGLFSTNPYDAAHGWCANCRVYVADVIEAPPEMRQVMGELYHADASRHVDRSAQLRRTAAAWLYLNTAVDPGGSERR